MIYKLCIPKYKLTTIIYKHRDTKKAADTVKLHSAASK